MIYVALTQKSPVDLTDLTEIEDGGTGDPYKITISQIRDFPLTGLSSTTGTILATDTPLQAFGKTQGRLSELETGVVNLDTLKVDIAGDTMTGKLGFSGTTHAGIQLNNLTTAQRDGLTPESGDLIYNSTTDTIDYWNGTAWTSPAGSGSDPSRILRAGDTMTGALGIIAGGETTPGLFISGSASTGLFSSGAGTISITCGATETIRISSGGFRCGSATLLGWGSSFAGNDLILGRAAAASLRMGVNSATPVAQKLLIGSAVGTNVVGANLTIQAGLGTGNAASGSLIFKVGSPGTSGSSEATPYNVLEFTGDGKIAFFNTIPVLRKDGWSLANVNEVTVFDADDTTINELADVVGTIIQTLMNYGLFAD